MANGGRTTRPTPRMSAVYDLFGNGTTAVKMTLGKYLEAQETGTFGEGLNKARRMASSTNRSWNDANRNFVPDCDLLNPVANGECGAYSNANFGRNVYSETFDPEMLTGWGQRLVAEGETPEGVHAVLSKPPRLVDLRRCLAESVMSKTQAEPTEKVMS